MASAAALRPTTLLLDWYPNSDHAGIFTAVHDGLYTKHGIKLTIQVPSDPTTALKLVAAGRADFAISYEPDVLLAQTHGIGVTAVMSLVQEPLNTVISLKSQHITSPRDLKGKTVGIAGLPSDYTVMQALMQHVGLPLSAVHLVNVGYNLVPALLAHRVDAIEGGYWSWEAIQIAQMGHPDNVLRINHWGVPSYDELVVVASNKLIRSHPHLVSAFVHATQLGIAQAIAHPSVAEQAILKAPQGAGQDLSPKLLDASLHVLLPAFHVYTKQPLGYMGVHAWQAYANWMLRTKLLAKPISAKNALTDAFLGRIR